MTIQNLIWDEWNIEHIARHNVEPNEVEEVCKNKHSFTRGRQNTYRVIGQTQGGRYLTVIVAVRGNGNFYPVTARDSDKWERKRLKKI